MVRVRTLSPSLSPSRDVQLTQVPFWHFQYCVLTGTDAGRVMVTVMVEPSAMPVILNEKKPWVKLKAGGVPQGLEAAAVRPVIEPLLVVKVAMPVLVAVFTCAVMSATLLVTA